MDTPTGAVWLGHCRLGGRFYLRTDEMHPGINILGAGANAIAAVLARACDEVKLTTLVLDFDGHLSENLDGCIEERRLGYFLYDSMKLDEKSLLHAELAASAYTISLNLTFEQEAFLNASMQVIGLEQGVATPASLGDRLNHAGEYRGHTADELKGKFEALKSLNLFGEAGAVKKMMGTSSLASFADAESHQAAEVAMMLFVSKVLALEAAGVKPPDVVVLNGANRVFSNLPLARHGNRLLTALLASEMVHTFVSEHTYGLDHHFADTAPTRILSSHLWNELTASPAPVGGLYTPHGVSRAKRHRLRDDAQKLILAPNMYVFQDLARGYEEVFVPRVFRGLRPAEEGTSPDAPPRKDDTQLVKLVLEAVSSTANSTRGSVVAYLSFENSREEVERVIDRLQADGFLGVVGRDVGRDSPLRALALTPTGYDLLRRLR